MAGIESMFFVIFGLLGGQGNELLNYVQSEGYWQSRDERIVDVTTMTAVLNDTEERPPSDKLMAIRTLGELGKAEEGADKQAVLKVLGPLVTSNEPFVGQYAKRSIAWVKGEDPPAAKKVTSAELESDLALLPKDCSIVAQMKIGAGAGVVDIAKLIPDMGPEAAEFRKKMLVDANSTLVKTAAMLGNVKIDAVTFGANFTGQGDSGYAVIVARGQYDRIGVQIAIEELAEGEGEELRQYSIGEVEVIAPVDEDEVAMLMPSDNVFVLLVGEPSENDPLPIEAVAKTFADKTRKPKFDGLIDGQIAKIDREKAEVWMAMQPKGPLVTERGISDIFGAYKAAHATATPDGKGGYDISWRAEGHNEAKVKDSVTFMQEGINEGIAEMKQMVNQAPQMKDMFTSMLKMMESIEVKQEGDIMTGGMKLDPGLMMSPFMMMGARF